MAISGMTVAESMQLQYEVEQFLYFEAELLDEKRFDEWLAILAEDLHYWMPIRRTRLGRELGQEFTALGDMAYFDDDKAFMIMRIEKMTAGNAWSEEPASRTRHFVTNIQVSVQDQEQNEIFVRSNFHLYRTRLESEEDSWIGRRVDVLRKNGAGFLLVKRHIFLEQTIIKSQNMSNIF